MAGIFDRRNSLRDSAHFSPGLIPGAPADQKIDIAMVVWMTAAAGTIFLAGGFHRQKYFDQFHPIDFLSPDKAVQEAGVDPASVTDIIISHAHWDHMDGIDLFPAATIWIQKAEYEYYTSAAWQPGGRHGGIEAEDVQELVRRNIAGKVRLVDGDDKEIFPEFARTRRNGTLTLRNISEWEVIRHLYSRQIIVTCMQYPGIASRGSDISTSDVRLEIRVMRSDDRAGGLADRVVPGHDPEHDHFPTVFGRVAHIK